MEGILIRAKANIVVLVATLLVFSFAGTCSAGFWDMMLEQTYNDLNKAYNSPSSSSSSSSSYSSSRSANYVESLTQMKPYSGEAERYEISCSDGDVGIVYRKNKSKRWDYSFMTGKSIGDALGFDSKEEAAKMFCN